MQYTQDDLGEIAAGFPDLEPGIERHLILIAALPGAGKTTLAKELARQTGGVHFEIDEVKRVVVPCDRVVDEIDPPEYRYKYYAETIRKLPQLFAQGPFNIVIIDEIFHFMWNYNSFYYLCVLAVFNYRSYSTGCYSTYFKSRKTHN